MSARDQLPAGSAGEPQRDKQRIEAARSRLAAIDVAVFPEAAPVPFYEQAVFIRRAVLRLLGRG